MEVVGKVIYEWMFFRQTMFDYWRVLSMGKLEVLEHPPKTTQHIYIYMFVYIYVYIYVCIYICVYKRERERYIVYK